MIYVNGITVNGSDTITINGVNYVFGHTLPGYIRVNNLLIGKNMYSISNNTLIEDIS